MFLEIVHFFGKAPFYASNLLLSQTESCPAKADNAYVILESTGAVHVFKPRYLSSEYKCSH